MAQLVAFFRVNGFKKGRELDVEAYSVTTRYRKRREYVPLPSEIAKMAIAGRNPGEKAPLLFVYGSGLRNSTARAVRYCDLKGELDAGSEVVHVPVTAAMKRADPDAAKGMVEYSAFIGREAVAALKEHLAWVEGRTGRSFPSEWPVFPGRTMDGSPIKETTLQQLVKRLARRAGLERWRDVYPHCLRKAFENALRNSGMDWKDQEILMGHILPGSMDTYADKTRVEEFREKYARVRFFPEDGHEERDAGRHEEGDSGACGLRRGGDEGTRRPLQVHQGGDGQDDRQEVAGEEDGADQRADPEGGVELGGQGPRRGGVGVRDLAGRAEARGGREAAEVSR